MTTQQQSTCYVPLIRFSATVILPFQLSIVTGPGPANYMLPTTVGRNSVDFTKRGSPAFSFGSRTWCK